MSGEELDSFFRLLILIFDFLVILTGKHLLYVIGLKLEHLVMAVEDGSKEFVPLLGTEEFGKIS